MDSIYATNQGEGKPSRIISIQLNSVKGFLVVTLKISPTVLSNT